MSSETQDLQSTADDTASVAGKSLENQMQLLNGQTQAMDGLSKLHGFQAQALKKAGIIIEIFYDGWKSTMVSLGTFIFFISISN
jgi:isocitrate lyase